MIARGAKPVKWTSASLRGLAVGTRGATRVRPPMFRIFWNIIAKNSVFRIQIVEKLVKDGELVKNLLVVFGIIRLCKFYNSLECLIVYSAIFLLTRN